MNDGSGRSLYDLILIDISNRYHAAFSTSSSMTTSLDDGTPLVTGGIYTTIRGIHKICRERLMPSGRVFYLGDATVLPSQGPLDEVPASLRRMIDPGYKADRKRHPSPSFYRGLELTYSILHNLRDRSYVVRCDGYEADDLAPAVIRRYAGPQDRALLVSGDSDWCRALGPRVDVLKRDYRLRKDVVYTLEAFVAENGFAPDGDRLILYKAVRGDSDNVPAAVAGIREEHLVRLINECPTLDLLKQRLPALDWLPQSWRAKIIEGWPRLSLNAKLIGFLPIDEASLDRGTYECGFQPRALRSQYDALGFDIGAVDPRVVGEQYARGSVDKESRFFISRRVKRA